MPETSSSHPAPSIEWGLWFQWVLATTLGWLLGLVILGETGIGLTVGVAQWLVLRTRLSRTGWWIIASAAGWLLGWAVLVSGLVLPPGTSGLTTVLSGAVLGLALGLAQWVALRQMMPQAGWWVFASVAGWTVALTGVLGQTVVGVVAGALTGFMLDFLLRAAPADDNPA
jgi:hypothetical protein